MYFQTVFYLTSRYLVYKKGNLYSLSIPLSIFLSSNFISQFDLDFVESILCSQDYLILCFYQLFFLLPKSTFSSNKTLFVILMQPEVNQL